MSDIKELVNGLRSNGEGCKCFAQSSGERELKLMAENAALLAANRDCIDHFDQLKVDFDDVRAENAKLRDSVAQLIDSIEFGRSIFGNRNSPPKLLEVMAWLASSETEVQAASAALGEK